MAINLLLFYLFLLYNLCKRAKITYLCTMQVLFRTLYTRT